LTCREDKDIFGTEFNLYHEKTLLHLISIAAF
jgi:hypothetical protein